MCCQSLRWHLDHPLWSQCDLQEASPELHVFAYKGHHSPLYRKSSSVRSTSLGVELSNLPLMKILNVVCILGVLILHIIDAMNDLTYEYIELVCFNGIFYSNNICIVVEFIAVS